MQIPLIVPTSSRYIHINPRTNRLHLLVPFVSGEVISTDNTCQSSVEVRKFFEGDAANELKCYASVLELHISLLKEDDPRHGVIEERLNQISLYLNTLRIMKRNYRNTINTFLAKPSNLYSIQLRPKFQDHLSRVINPVFTICRENDSLGIPLSSLYNEMHSVFPNIILGQPTPRQKLISNVLDALPEAMRYSPVLDEDNFAYLQDLLTATYKAELVEEVASKLQDDFFKSTVDKQQGTQIVNKAYIDNIMGFKGTEKPQEYLAVLINICAPNLETYQKGSPFYLVDNNNHNKAEHLSIVTQLYLGVLNVYCRAKGISGKNFGKVLDENAELSHALVKEIAEALTRGDEVETCIINFFNAHPSKNEFDLAIPTDLDDSEIENDESIIQQQFELAWRTISATKENHYMDDFMLLDSEAEGENAIFLTRNGLICTDFANIESAIQANQDYFTEIDQAATNNSNFIAPQDEPVVNLDIELDELRDRIDQIEWGILPKKVRDEFCYLLEFQTFRFHEDVAKGKQEKAERQLETDNDTQLLLITPANFTDYSKRTFNCTAFEYAYWAKDKHMCQMLKRHMNEDTKALLSGKVNEIEQFGLAYQQHGIDYKTPHYDMSFVLRELTTTEFLKLQIISGQTFPKIQQATTDNYHLLAFSADEYEELKQALEPAKKSRITSFFSSSAPSNISNKLKFDFNSVITELETYVVNYEAYNRQQREVAWLKVGQAQRDVPTHIAHEYCRIDGRFINNSFNEDNIPRTLKINNHTNFRASWFPLSSTSSGLGFNFAINGRRSEEIYAKGLTSVRHHYAALDMVALRRLNEARNNDLELLLASLSPAISSLAIAS